MDQFSRRSDMPRKIRELGSRSCKFLLRRFFLSVNARTDADMVKIRQLVGNDFAILLALLSRNQALSVRYPHFRFVFALYSGHKILLLIKPLGAPKGLVLDMLLPPEASEERLASLFNRYDNSWTKKYPRRIANYLFHWQSWRAVLSFYKAELIAAFTFWMAKGN